VLLPRPPLLGTARSPPVHRPRAGASAVAPPGRPLLVQAPPAARHTSRCAPACAACSSNMRSPAFSIACVTTGMVLSSTVYSSLHAHCTANRYIRTLLAVLEGQLPTTSPNTSRACLLCPTGRQVGACQRTPFAVAPPCASCDTPVGPLCA